MSLHNSGRFWCWKAGQFDIESWLFSWISMISTHSLPFCYRSVCIVSRYYFLPLGRTGLHDWNVHSTFSHCDLRTFGASEEIVTSGEVGFVLLILLIVHCWDSRLRIGVFQLMCPTCTVMCLDPSNLNLSIPTEGTRPTNSTQVGSQFSGHRFYRSWTAAATVLPILCPSMPLNSEKVHNGNLIF